MDAFSYIKNKVYTRLKPSRIEGVGVFALRDIPSLTPVFEVWKGESGAYSITEEQMQELPRELRLHIKSVFTYGPNFPKDSNTYISLRNGCHWIYQSPYFFVNSGDSSYNIDKHTHTTVKDIKAGQEILSNYGRYERSKTLL